MLQITSLDLDNYGMNAKCQKIGSKKQSNGLMESSPTSQASLVEDAIIGRQDQKLEASSVGESTYLSVHNQPSDGQATDIRTPLMCSFVPFWRISPHVEDKPDSTSSENFSALENCCSTPPDLSLSLGRSTPPLTGKYVRFGHRSPRVDDKIDSTSSENFSTMEDCCSTPRALSLTFGWSPTSPVSILKRAAETFERPSIIKRQNLGEKAKEFDCVPCSSERAGSYHKNECGKIDLQNAEEFSCLSRDYLSLGTFGSIGSVGKRLEQEFDRVDDASCQSQG